MTVFNLSRSHFRVTVHGAVTLRRTLPQLLMDKPQEAIQLLQVPLTRPLTVALQRLQQPMACLQDPGSIAAMMAKITVEKRSRKALLENPCSSVQLVVSPLGLWEVLSCITL